MKRIKPEVGQRWKSTQPGRTHRSFTIKSIHDGVAVCVNDKTKRKSEISLVQFYPEKRRYLLA